MVVKLADDVIREEWENHKAYLMQLGFLQNPENLHNHSDILRNRNMIRIAEMAYRQGFVDGTQLDAQAPKPEPVKKRQYKAPRNNRSEEQRSRDNKAVEVLLYTANREMPLAQIIDNMNKRGFKHWNNGNASGFVQRAIKDGMAIERAGTGFYRYAEKGEKK